MASRLEIERFDGKGDFSIWKGRLRALLIYNDVFDVIEDKPPVEGGEVSAEATKKWRKMDRVAHSIITLHLTDKISRVVGKCETAIELWDKLDRHFLVKSLPNQILLKEKLFSFKCLPSKSFEESLDSFIKITTDLANIGCPVNEVDQSVVLLNSLPDEFNDVKAAIKYGRNTLEFEEVVEALKSKELDLKKNRRGNEVLFSRGREERRNFGNYGSQGNVSGSSSNNGSGRFRSKSRSKSRPRRETRKCHFCQKEGHLKRNCFEFKKSQGKGEDSKGDKETANVAHDFENLRVFFINEKEEALISQTQDQEWVVDSGCSYHMSPNREFFHGLQPTVGKNVFMGNDAQCKIEGIGNIWLKFDDGTEGLLSNVRYVPDLKRNLISMPTLDKSGHTFKGSNGKLRIHKGSLVVMKAELQGGLYILNGHAVAANEAALLGANEKFNKSNLWHNRLGHISDKRLIELCKQGAFGEDKVEAVSTCEICLQGKATRVKFAKGIHCTEGKLDYIHSDLWGPSPTTTHGGSRYFMSIIDDYSRKVWIYPMEHKSEAFQTFKMWMNLVQNQTGRKVKVLRTDNGLEFLNNNFKQLCDDNGIKRHLTTPYTPQQNGVAERMNRTILDRTRCMLLNAKMPLEFWGEAVVTAGYLINRTPTKALDNKTPEEMWTGSPPKLDNLKVFGCAVFAHVSQGKLNPRAEKCVFLGYSKEAKAYRLWSLENKKAILSRNAKFVEDLMPFKEVETGNSASSMHDEDMNLGKIRSATSTPFGNSGDSEGRVGNSDLGSSTNSENNTSSNSENNTSSSEVSSSPTGNSTGEFSSGSGNSTGEFSSGSGNRSSPTVSGSRSSEETGSGSQNGSQNQEDGSGSLNQENQFQNIYDDSANQQDLRIDSERMRRHVRKPTRYGFDEFAHISCEDVLEEPTNLKAVFHSKQKTEWLAAIQEELDSLHKNSTWILVDKPSDKKVIGSKWIFKVKMEGKAVRFKARLVAKGYTQEHGVDFDEVFSPVVRHTSIRVLLSLAAKEDLELEQMDVKTAFLHGNIEEKIHMQQPPGFEVKGAENKVCLLKKSLYGLKQSPRQWYKRFDDFISSKGFDRSKFDSCVYFKHCHNLDSIYLLLYVDDMLIACKDKGLISEVKHMLGSEFEMKDLGPSRRILGMEIERERKNGILKLSQPKYIWKLLEMFQMDDSRAVGQPFAPHFKFSNELCPKSDFEEKEMATIPYSNAVGSLMYLMICTRPDLAHALSMVSRYMANPGKGHWEGVKWILRYLNGTRNGGLMFGKSGNSRKEEVADVIGYVDADYASDLDKRRSNTGFVFKVFESVVSWKSSLQNVVALSTTESEYIALTEATKEGVWLKGILGELCKKNCHVEIYCDSQSAIHLANHQAFHERTKHIDVRLHFVREIFNKTDFKLIKVASQVNAADFLTKVVAKVKLDVCLGMLHFDNG